jgi:hypothetical protein
MLAGILMLGILVVTSLPQYLLELVILKKMKLFEMRKIDMSQSKIS